MPRLMATLQRVDPEQAFIRYWGAVDYRELDDRYADAELCVFASSCENMPNILIEGMASALPIACSDRGPMPEVLGDAGLYFDPENPASIADAIRRFVVSAELRTEKAAAAATAAQQFSWSRCADETLRFLTGVVRAGKARAQAR